MYGIDNDEPKEACINIFKKSGLLALEAMKDRKKFLSRKKGQAKNEESKNYWSQQINAITEAIEDIETDYVGIEGYYGYKWPKLSELHYHLFGEDFEGAHNSKNDVAATSKCFFELKKRGVI